MVIELVSKLLGEPSKDLEISTRATVVSTFEGWGTSLAWFANVVGTGPISQKEPIADLLFDVEQGLGLNIVRYNIGGGENPNMGVTLEPRACIPGLYTSAHQVSSLSLEQDSGQLWFLHAAVKRGVDRMEAFSNSPPYFMTKSGSVTGARKSSENNLREDQLDNFAEYLCKSTQLLESSCHIPCQSIEPFNEPLSSWWKLGGRQEGCYFDIRLQEKMINSLYYHIRKANLDCGIAAPDTYSTEEARRLLNKYSSQTLSQLYRINTHTYSAKGRKNLYDICSKRRKSLWVSEYGDNDGSGISLAQTIISDLKELNPTAWIYWQAVEDSSAPHWGFLVCNLNQNRDDSFSIQKKFYIMLQFSKFIRPGFQQVYIEDDRTVAFRSPDGTKIVLVHVQRQQMTYHLYFKDWDRNSFAQISVYRTSSHENMERIAFYQRWPLQRRLSLFMTSNSVTTIAIS
ncbi:hypothetical protein GpartN1_g7439.t1 [Galdieria partita]|uniref:Endo-beta-1,6-galactanase-like domain-containing protein n=1 Tax=Galdieria partita TaxID=83374 RepID=A0A9C7Q378_9RHOD|nr:hypothetical protein GpartN1_g7439.t1 [Galdieria partita]